jgi:DNA-binding GntR family transcriptional regulator
MLPSVASHAISPKGATTDTSSTGVEKPDSGADGSHVYQAIRGLVLEGDYPPGSRLKEAETAALLGVSRTPVREALLQLEVEGLVELIPNRGAIVRELTQADVHEILVLRAILEAFCASTAATSMDDQGIDHLDVLHTELEHEATRPGGDGQAKTLAALNGGFHRAVIGGSGNTRIAALLEKLVAIPAAWRTSFWNSRRHREAAVVYHREVVDAIRARDPLRADAVMKSHIYAAKDYFVDQLGSTNTAE